MHGGIRTYYGGLPDVIQVGEHQFVEARVLELFTAQALHAWTSATNASRIYDTAFNTANSFSDNTQVPRFSLTTEQVLDGFILNALLRDHAARDETLHIPHTGDQKDRLTLAIRQRNLRIRHSGQPEWAHYCNRCTDKYDDSEGNPST